MRTCSNAQSNRACNRHDRHADRSDRHGRNQRAWRSQLAPALPSCNAAFASTSARTCGRKLSRASAVAAHQSAYAPGRQ
ncbi:hypothetical protein F7R02_15305 [Xanthomonas cissicola]|nr:hypothetical protein F7R02_15305 [Xanthomonas cissicola]